nr:ABC transporter substrate-binding protein [Pusillimonas caeni]
MLAATSGFAAEAPFKIGLITPMTGPFASTGKQHEMGARLYMEQHGDEVAGRKIQLILKDDGGVQPETTKRIAQELVVKEHVNVLAGFGLTPLAFAAAPVATQAKVPMIVMSAATLSIVERSPFIVRTSQNLPQTTAPIADWAIKNDIKKVVTLVSDYGPGHDAEKVFLKRFTDAGGTVADALRIPLQNPDFAPFLQRVRDIKPDAVFVFVPSGVGTPLMKQFADRGLKEAGIRLIGTGDMLEDDLLPSMGDEALDVITSHHYSAAHDSPENKAYVEAFSKFTNNQMRASFQSVQAYDGMHLIYEALKKAGPDATGEQLLEAMKGMQWTSPRGPVQIDADNRDIIQDIYIRRAEKVDGELYNIEFDKFEQFVGPRDILEPAK